MSVREFGRLGEEPIQEITIRSKAGAEAQVITWGAVVRDFHVPLPGGGRQRVVLGFEDLDAYVKHSPHMGAIAGRYANRIAEGRFTLDGKTYQLERNQNGRHALHGGSAGFGKRPWRLAARDDNSVTLTLVSPDGDGGYPGQVTVTCRYILLEPATLRVELSATTDAPTIINLAQHTYWTLDGAPSVLDHELQLAADFYTPVDEEQIATGEVLAVAGTPFDFRRARALRQSGPDGAPFKLDHNFVLTSHRPDAASALRKAATLRSPRSGLTLELHTTEPGVQVYDGWKISLPVTGLGDQRYGANAGLCLESQVWPGSPNHQHFPNPTLRPGQVYRQVSEYRIG
ncbi:galactose-1-epimerase [Alsobacter soli]|uniref:Aldose 1-epimerase n=1 Tax=Alsobacter soli TaxID=2109933 RepID=A0A2T1HSJ5_9HYPH|nr:aldose epimerase family protein [Alsobacter soli]PSC04499.1 galactose-1-epimerase [Alsobacter soli]